MTHIETPTGEANVVNGGLTATAAAHALETFLLTPAQLIADCLSARARKQTL